MLLSRIDPDPIFMAGLCHSFECRARKPGILEVTKRWEGSFNWQFGEAVAEGVDNQFRRSETASLENTELRW